MRPRLSRQRASAALFCSAIAGLPDGLGAQVICSRDRRPGVVVEVTVDHRGDTARVRPVGVVREGAYVDTLHLVAFSDSSIAMGGVTERAGSYEVVLSAPG